MIRTGVESPRESRAGRDDEEEHVPERDKTLPPTRTTLPSAVLSSLCEGVAAAERRSDFVRAARLCLQIARFDRDPHWHQRAGEAFLKASRKIEAAVAFCDAATLYL